MKPIQELDKEIIGQAFTSHHAYHVLSHLCQTYGARFAGTEEERLAAKYIADLMGTYGLERVSLKPFSYRGWRRGSLNLSLYKGGEWVPLDGISLPYSPSREVEAQVVDVGTGTEEEFSSLSSQLKGKIALVSAIRPLYRQRSMHRKDKYLRSVKAGALGFLWMREVGGHLEETGSLPHDAPIPGVGISFETGFKMKEALKQEDIKVRLESDTRFLDVESFNVEGTIPGTSKGQLLVGAHYDGHDIAEGALDNGAGTTILLETARLLSKYKESLKRSITFVCFAAEEVGLLGSAKYVEECEDEAIDFMINLDGGPGRSGRMGLALQNYGELIPHFERLAQDMGEDLIIALHPGSHSDMYSFSQAGIPSGYLRDMERLSSGRDWGHTRADTLDKVEEARLREDAQLLARLLLRLSNLYPWPLSSSKF